MKFLDLYFYLVLKIFLVRASSSKDLNTMKPIIIVHGGAGDIPDVRVPLKIRGVKESAKVGYAVLKNGGTALDAVEAAVRYMENEEAFNAGELILNIYWFHDQYHK